jgi:hypothetical protein
MALAESDWKWWVIGIGVLTVHVLLEGDGKLRSLYDFDYFMFKMKITGSREKTFLPTVL